MANSSAWFRIQCPTMGGVTRELCIQRGTTNLVWKIKYSYSAGFTGGSPGATRVPSAADEKTLIGGGTDASPTFFTLFAADASYRIIAGAGDEDEGYTFYSAAYASGAVNSMLLMDAIQSETMSTQDVDGYIFFASSNTGSSINSAIGSMQRPGLSDGPKTWLRKGYSNEIFTNVIFLGYYYTSAGGNAIGETFLGVNYFDLKDQALPLLWSCLGEVSFTGKDTSSGFKGSSRMMRLGSCSRLTPTLLSFESKFDKVQVDKLVFPWGGTSLTP